MRTVVINGFFKMLTIKEEYKLSCGNLGLKKDLVKLWMHSLLVILSPVIPHFCEFTWQNYYKKILSEDEIKNTSECVVNAPFPRFDSNTINLLILKQNDYLIKVGS